MSETFSLAIQPAIDLQATLMGGQAFRWKEQENGWFSGVVKGSLVKVKEAEGGVEFRGNRTESELRPLLESYFRLDDDIEAIHGELSRDPIIARLIREYPGLRLLRQDPWECLVAYCCSAPNSVQGITRLVEKLAKELGDPLECCGQELYIFPSPERIADVTEAKLREMGLGLHAPRIVRVSAEVSNGSLNLDWLRAAPYPEVKKTLMNYRGIKHKVAACVSLFSLDKMEAFPVDRNIGKALVRYCFPELRETQLRTLEKRGEQHFGQYAGYAGQFLFHDMRQKSTR